MDKTVNDNAKFVNYCGDYSSYPHYGATIFKFESFSTSLDSSFLNVYLLEASYLKTLMYDQI